MKISEHSSKRNFRYFLRTKVWRHLSLARADRSSITRQSKSQIFYTVVSAYHPERTLVTIHFLPSCGMGSRRKKMSQKRGLFSLFLISVRSVKRLGRISTLTTSTMGVFAL